MAVPDAMLPALIALAAAAGPLLFTSGTEAPLKTEQLALPARCSLCPPGKVSCSHYPSFTVKEVDLGDRGAELLAIVPRRAKGPPPSCRAERSPDELSVSGGAEPWEGYFEGARGRFVFFRSSDGSVGAHVFAVYDATDGHRILAAESVGPVKVEAKGARVGLAFVRRSLAPCSPLAGGERCWSRIKAELGVADPAPDCATAYREANETAAKVACEGDASPRCIEQELRLRPALPSVVPPVLEYEVELHDLSAAEPKAAPDAKVVACRPPE